MLQEHAIELEEEHSLRRMRAIAHELARRKKKYSLQPPKRLPEKVLERMLRKRIQDVHLRAFMGREPRFRTLKGAKRWCERLFYHYPLGSKNTTYSFLMELASFIRRPDMTDTIVAAVMDGAIVAKVLNT